MSLIQVDHCDVKDMSEVGGFQSFKTEAVVRFSCQLCFIKSVSKLFF